MSARYYPYSYVEQHAKQHEQIAAQIAAAELMNECFRTNPKKRVPYNEATEKLYFECLTRECYSVASDALKQDKADLEILKDDQQRFWRGAEARIIDEQENEDMQRLLRDEGRVRVQVNMASLHTDVIITWWSRHTRFRFCRGKLGLIDRMRMDTDPLRLLVYPLIRFALEKARNLSLPADQTVQALFYDMRSYLQKQGFLDQMNRFRSPKQPLTNTPFSQHALPATRASSDRATAATATTTIPGTRPSQRENYFPGFSAASSASTSTRSVATCFTARSRRNVRMKRPVQVQTSRPLDRTAEPKAAVAVPTTTSIAEPAYHSGSRHSATVLAAASTSISTAIGTTDSRCRSFADLNAPRAEGQSHVSYIVPPVAAPDSRASSNAIKVTQTMQRVTGRAQDIVETGAVPQTADSRSAAATPVTRTTMSLGDPGNLAVPAPARESRFRKWM